MTTDPIKPNDRGLLVVEADAAASTQAVEIAPSTSALDALRATFDAGALELWNVRGPSQTTPSRLSGVLVKIKGQRIVVIVQSFEDGTYGLFGETDIDALDEGLA